VKGTKCLEAQQAQLTVNSKMPAPPLSLVMLYTGSLPQPRSPALDGSCCFAAGREARDQGHEPNQSIDFSRI